RVTGEDRKPVFFGRLLEDGIKSVVHTEVVGDDLRLIVPARARTMGVDLLNRHNIGIKVVDDPRDSLGTDPTIETDATVNVVGHDSQGQVSLARFPRKDDLAALAFLTEILPHHFAQVGSANP